jgi:glycosyltransferase involved in cell wall biosynthesis
VKVVQVHTQAAAGGTQRVSDMVASGLAARGHQTRAVFMYRYSDAYDDAKDADILSRNKASGLRDKLSVAWALMAYLRRNKPDVVITYDYWGNFFGAIGARLARVPIVIANQGLEPARSGKLAIASFLDMICGSLGGYSYNVVNSGWTQAQYDRYPGIYKQRLRLISHGCWQPKVRIDRATARDRFGLPQDVQIVVSVGRLSDLKNQAALVGALPQLPGVHLALAGNGPARAQLVAMAEANGSRDRLHLVGEVPRTQVYDFLVAGDVFAFPSHSETFGLAAVEAAIAGVPVVASDLSVLREVLEDDDGQPAAVFAETRDADGFARAISMTLSRPDLVERLTRAGKTLADKYDPDRMAAGYAELLEHTA